MGLLDATVHDIAWVLQGVVAAVPSLSPAPPSGSVAALSLIHLRFSYGVAGDLTTLNESLLIGIPS